MRRFLIGLGSLLFMLVTIILVVPLFLPKDEIKRQVVEQVDKRFGWRVRLDGPVSLSLFPGFSLVAEDIGLAGEAGADGIEFAKAERVEFGLAWGGLVSGNIQVTGIALDKPDIYLEIGPNGTTSWEPRRDISDIGDLIEAETGDAETDAVAEAAPAPASEAEPAETTAASEGYLKSIGVDSLQITGGTVTYKAPDAAEPVRISNLDLSLQAPSLSGEVDLTSSFTFREMPVAVAGSLTNPLALMGGEQVPVDLKISSGENSVSVTGQSGLDPTRAELALSAAGPSLKALAALAGQDLAADPGAFAVSAKVAGTEAMLSLADLDITLGQLSLGGAADADLSGNVPEVSGRLVLKDGSIADLLQLAGRDLPASGKLSLDLAFATVGQTGEELLAGLDITGPYVSPRARLADLGLLRRSAAIRKRTA